ncbi:hypothetical protein M2317_001124 [Microbacterium sp. ZKA21]|uniref:DUF3841 domain-containing protein n=1 Tax=Microbacterium sp. ZKA21 TaxID=3381694 RepID=UPI003D2427AB
MPTGILLLMPPFPIRTAAPALAVPPGRLGYDLDAETMLLHSIQSAEAFDVLLETGVLRADPTLADSPWPEAYEWMNRMMAERLPTSGDAALWLWVRIRRRHLVALCRRARGEVLLTCRIPRGRVLVSHFGEWHVALNSGLSVPQHPGESEDEYDKRNDREFDDFADRVDAAGARNSPLGDWPFELRTELERSWECILDRTLFPKTDH